MRTPLAHILSVVAPWSLMVVFGGLTVACSGANTQAPQISTDDNSADAAELVYGSVQRVAELSSMPSGLAIWGDRVFLSQPRWTQVDGVEVDATVVELIDGEVVPYPNADLNDVSDVANLQSVNGLHIDARGRLWMLDNGRVNLAPGQDETATMSKLRDLVQDA